METMIQDVRYSLRALRRRPGFVAMSVLILALGIGVNSAIFSVINAVLLKSLNVPEPDRLVMVYETNLSKGVTQANVAPANFLAWRDQNSVFEEIAAFVGQSFTLSGENEPELLEGARASASLFTVLAAEPILGRTFTAEEDRPGSSPVVLLSQRLWQRRFGSDPNVVGQAIKLDGIHYTIVGVMAPDFAFPNAGTELWAPVAMNAESGMSGMSGRVLMALARLKPGVTLGQAEAEMNVAAGRMEQENPQFNAGLGVRLVALHEAVVRNIRPILLVLFGAVGFVLLIACANVANLLLARASARHKEIAIRMALGANRLRLIRQLLTESVLLSLGGGGLGLLLALWGVDALVALQPGGIPRAQEISVDNQVLAFTFAVSILTGVLFGLVPALQASRPNLIESLKEGARSTASSGRGAARSLLVIAEVALSLVLLIGAGLMVRSFMRLQSVDPGFNAQNLLTFQVSLPEGRYPEAGQVTNFYQQVLERIQALPGVVLVGATHALPTTGGGGERPLIIEGRQLPDQQSPILQYRLISPGYFRAMGIPILEGRDFTERESGQAPGVVIINRAAALRFWPGESPIGQRVSLGGYPDLWGEVVGVAGDVRHWGMEVAAQPEMFWHYSQSWLGRSPTLLRFRRTLTVVARTASDPERLVGEVRREVTAFDNELPISNVKTMEQRLEGSLSRPRFSTLLIGLFAGVALILSAAGIYGVMSYSVTQRTHEIGIRMALGAEARDVLRLVVGQGLRLALAGVGIGLAAALATTRVLSSFLYEVSATDPLTFASIALAVTAVALMASYIPARRAARVDPMVALRHE